jgi:hypothetical protein
MKTRCIDGKRERERERRGRGWTTNNNMDIPR